LTHLIVLKKILKFEISRSISSIHLYIYTSIHLSNLYIYPPLVNNISCDLHKKERRIGEFLCFFKGLKSKQKYQERMAPSINEIFDKIKAGVEADPSLVKKV